MFGKNSWGRAVLFGFTGAVVQAASTMVPSTEPLEAKLSKWCEAEPAATGG